ncbi:MAG: lipopolysaccharide biosynthesis protein [Saprospiraceae bacterium]|nr:lipopolysaccharide biosynthesis protein [Saprospiraceae bacterium]
MSTLINKTIHGLSWNFKSQMITQGINFLVAFLLMLYLVPEDFGKFAMVFVIVRFFQIIREAGFTVAIIQKKELTQSSLSTAFWFQILLAVFIGGLLFYSGSLFNIFYEETVLNQISFWLSVDFIIGSFGLVPTALLRKELKFKALFKIHLVAVIISSTVGIGMALGGMGYLSLVGKILSWTVITSFGNFFFIQWKPQFQFSIKELRSLLRLGLPDTGNYILWYLTMNTDDFFIGRIIGASSLGYYNRAYNIMLLPLINISSVLQSVLFSTWSKIQDDKSRINRMYLLVSGIIALIACPAMTLLAVFSEPIISVMFGANWLPMATTLSILSIIGIFQSVSALLGVIYIVFDKNSLAFKINLIASTFTIALIIWSVYIFRSIEITALVYGVTFLIRLFPTYYFASKTMGIPTERLISPIIFPFIFSIITGVFGWFLFQILPFETLLLRLIFSLFSSSLLYFIFCWIFKIPPFMDLLNAIKQYRIEIKK